MITKQEYIASLTKEFNIICHLASKIKDTDLDYKPTDAQRTTMELLRYLSYVFIATVKVLENGDQGIYMELSKKADDLKLEDFIESMQNQLKDVTEIVNNFSDEQLNESVDLWGVQSRAMHLLNSPLKWATAYKIQLFLYMKANGHAKLNTMNLWAGMDPVE